MWLKKTMPALLPVFSRRFPTLDSCNTGGRTTLHLHNHAERKTMKSLFPLTTLCLGAILMTHVALAASPDAATDPRIDPQVRSFLAKINKDSSPFWELPQPKPQDILTGLQSQEIVDMSGVTTTERTIDQDGRKVKLYIMKPDQMGDNSRRAVLHSWRRLDRRQFPEPSAPVARSGRRLAPDWRVCRIHAAAASQISDPARGVLFGSEMGRRACRRFGCRRHADRDLPAIRSAAT